MHCIFIGGPRHGEGGVFEGDTVQVAVQNSQPIGACPVGTPPTSTLTTLTYVKWMPFQFGQETYWLMKLEQDMAGTEEDHRRLLLAFADWLNSNVICGIDDCEIGRMDMERGKLVDEFLASRHAATPSKGE